MHERFLCNHTKYAGCHESDPYDWPMNTIHGLHGLHGHGNMYYTRAR